jgi:hypothetical protein
MRVSSKFFVYLFTYDRNGALRKLDYLPAAGLGL